MSKRHNMSKQELINKAKQERTTFNYKGQLILTMAILYDDFGWEAEDLCDFMDKYDFHAQEYLAHREDILEMGRKLEEITGRRLFKK